MRRVTLLLVAAVVGAVAYVSTSRSAVRPPSASAPPIDTEGASLPATTGSPHAGSTRCTPREGRPARHRLGVSPGFTLISDDSTRVDRELDGMAAAGVCWIRIDIDWSRVQPAPDRFDWAATDRAVQGARDRGMEVLALVAYTPTWARPHATSDKHPPSDPGTFAAFAGAAASRYRQIGVRTWEIWNEPNISDFWEPRADPEAYAELLDAGARSIRAVDPDAVIITAGLSPASDSGTNMAPVTFLDRLYEVGAADSFDAVAMHPYSYPLHPLAPEPLNHFVGVTPELREVMVEHDDADAPIWATEFGAPTGTSDQAVSPEEQGEQLAEAIEQWLSWEWSGPLMIYSWRDRGTDATDREQNFGLLYHDFRPKPALDVLLAVTGGTPP